MAVSHQPAFDPRRDPLSKATLAALEAVAGGSAATASNRSFNAGWPEEGANPAPNAAASPDHDGHGSGESQGAGTGDD